jgi:hypothetical protein
MLHLAFFLLLYFLPTLVGRDKQDASGIFLLNLFLGWTVIGWVIALIWAVGAPKAIHPVAAYRYCSSCGRAAYPGAHFCTACGRTV